MTGKPSYDELEKRVKELEKESVMRKQAEEALRESEERYRMTVERSSDGVAIVEGNSHIYVNEEFARIFGCDRPEEIVGKPISQFVHPDDFERVAHFNHSRQQGEAAPSRYECKGIRKDGSLVHLSVSAGSTTYHGKPVSLVFLRDVSERKLAEQKLSESEAKYRMIFENIQDVYYEVTLDGIVMEVSPSIERVSGYQRGQVIGRSLYDIYVDPTAREEFVKELLKEGKVTDYEVLLRDADGFHAYCSLNAGLVRDQHNNPAKIVGSLRNITERKRIEHALRESESQTRAILAASPVGIALARDRTIIWANRAMYALLGYKEEESLRGKSTRLIYPDDVEYDRVGGELYSALEAKGAAQIETRWIKKNGKVVHCYVQACLLDPSNPAKGLIAAAMDITDRKQAEDQIHRLSHELIRAQENERLRISRELHDRVAQDLSTAKVVADRIFRSQADVASPEVRQEISGISRTLQEVINAVRNLAYDLRPPVLDDMGLVHAISQYCEEF